MQSHYVNAFEDHACDKLSAAIHHSLAKENVKNKDIIILCIGTDRATGDCLGPLVGQFLKNSCNNLYVYGTLAQPVHALNLEQTIKEIYEKHERPYIIAVDASLGVREHIGYATVSRSPLVPGKGVNKKMPAIGNLSITGIVNISGFPNSILLQNTRLHIVITLASCIGNALSKNFASY